MAEKTSSPSDRQKIAHSIEAQFRHAQLDGQK